MSEVKGRAQTRTDEPQDAEGADASEADAPAGRRARGAPRSGTRAQAKRRRILFVTAAVVLVGLATSAAVWYETRPAPSVKVTGAFGKALSLKAPGDKAPVKRQVKEVVRGSGAAVA